VDAEDIKWAIEVHVDLSSRYEDPNLTVGEAIKVVGMPTGILFFGNEDAPEKVLATWDAEPNHLNANYVELPLL
jgi:hypothetical protein